MSENQFVNLVNAVLYRCCRYNKLWQEGLLTSEERDKGIAKMLKEFDTTTTLLYDLDLISKKSFDIYQKNLKDIMIMFDIPAKKILAA